MLKYLLFLFLALGTVLFSSSVTAMESQQYQLQSEEVVTESLDQNTPSTSYLLNVSDLKELNQNGFVIHPDIKYPFSISVNNAEISFGNITPNRIVSISNTLHILSKTSFQIQLSEVRALNSVSGDFIPNTNCDSGCTYLLAKPWINNSAHGFGFTVKGENAAEDFKNANYFRTLADLSKKEDPAVIFKGLNSENASLDLVFRLNPNPGNAQSYSTIINIDALPGY